MNILKNVSLLAVSLFPVLLNLSVNSMEYPAAHMNIFEAAEKGDLEQVRALIKAGVNVNQQNNAGLTPLHKAVWAGHIDIVKILIHAKASLDIKDAFKSTPLGVALWFRNKEMTDLLVRHENFTKNAKREPVLIRRRKKCVGQKTHHHEQPLEQMDVVIDIDQYTQQASYTTSYSETESDECWHPCCIIS